MSDVSESPPHKKRRTDETTRPTFRTRISPMGLHDLVTKLSKEQKTAVKDIGFGSILNLGISKSPVQFSRTIVSLFNPERRALILPNGEELRIEEDDVQCVLNIPRGDLEVQESIGVDSDPDEYFNFMSEWRRRWGIVENRGGPLTNEMPKQMLMNKLGDDNFKIDFIVYVVSSFLWTSQSRQCRFQILKSLQDVSRIKDYNWCKFTLDGLVDGVMKWHNNPVSYFQGPLTFLLVCYMDRVFFEKAYQKIPRTFPILGCWDNRKLYDRIAYESKHGGFGQGRVIPRINITREDEPIQEDSGLSSMIPKLLKKLADGIQHMADGTRLVAEGVQELDDISKSWNVNATNYFELSMIPLTELFRENSMFRDFIANLCAKDNVGFVGEDDVEDSNSSAYEELPDEGFEPPASKIVPPTKQKSLKIAAACKAKSFVNIMKDVNGLSTTDKEIVCYTIMEKLDDSEILFQCKYISLTRNHLKSLRHGEHVESDIVDAWAILMNASSPKNPKNRRVYFTTNPANMLRDEDMFQLSLQSEMESFELSKHDIETADLIFLPVLFCKHYFLVCYNMPKKTIQVIDNRKYEEVPFESKYSDMKIMVKKFIRFLKLIGSSTVESVSKFRVEVLEMPWQDNRDYPNCGVYTMRHMETYTGDQRNWECGITVKNATSKLRDLRYKYMVLIVDSEINANRIQNIGEVHP